jgi:hypothetical protein
MSKITVDKNQLKIVRDNIDHLLKNGKPTFSVGIQQPIYEDDI